MTKKNLINFLLIVLYVAVTFFIGCIPEDTLQWSADGSVGIYSKGGALFLVDGNSGSLTQIAPETTTTLWPAISPDGRFIAYGQRISVENFDEALNILPPNQIKILKTHAAAVKEKIQNKVEGGDVLSDGVLESYNKEYRSWIIHYLFKKLDSDGAITKKLGTLAVDKALTEPLNYYRLILIPSGDLDKKTVVAVSILNIWKVSFSPDSNLIAYVTNRIKGDVFEYGFDLYVASPAQQIPAALVERTVAIGCDFRPDSRAVAYLKPEKEEFEDQDFLPGSLVEKVIAKPNGELIAEPADAEKETGLSTHVCTGSEEELAGVLYCSWMVVQYADDSRIFFSSAKMSLPTSKIDEEKNSLFCCDTNTGTVSEILPETALDFTQGNCHLFALPRDSRKILLPGNKNTLGIYALGQDPDSSKILIDKDESFGDDSPPELVSQWKGKDKVSCLVAENSHYLADDPNAARGRKEVVIIDTDGNLVQVLSKDWPDELLDY
jgi:hypothetical protein